MKYGKKSLFSLIALVSTVGCSAPDTKEDNLKEHYREPEIEQTIQQFCQAGPSEEYINTTYEFEQKHGLDTKDSFWSEWVVDNFNRYCKALYQKNHFIGKYGERHVIFGVNYHPSSDFEYAKPWKSEQEHMRALETLAELTYPGWDFTFHFNPNETQDIDGTIYLGYEGGSHISYPNLFLHYETIVAHELGHFLGLSHHYDSLDQMGQGNHTALDDERCIMDRNSVEYCSAARFTLELDLFVDNKDLIGQSLSRILDHYPNDW